MTRPSIAVCVGLMMLSSCRASEADCAKLGDKFVELYEAQLSENGKQLSATVRDNAAQAGREEVVEQCTAKVPSKASIERCLLAETLEEFDNC